MAEEGAKIIKRRFNFNFNKERNRDMALLCPLSALLCPLCRLSEKEV